MADNKSLSEEPSFVDLDPRYSTTHRLSKLQPLLVGHHGSKIQSSLFSKTKSADGGLRRSGYFKYTSSGQPLITVITVVYNGDKHLEQTIQSVIHQTYNNLEYIVIDGSSTDKTLDIIRQYEGMIDYWLSEQDQGIADAMNKAIALATGEYLVFIHADDYFECNDSLKIAIQQVNESEIVLFDILYGANLKKLSPRGFNFWINFKTGVYHQASLCRREVFNGIGGFDTDFKIAMDYDFFLRAYRRGVINQSLPSVLSVMRDTGISSRKDIDSVLERLAEERKVHDKNCPHFLMATLYKGYWFFYMFYKKLTYLIK
jgi:glycosyltransferase involved in cell wall biosynthesis